MDKKDFKDEEAIAEINEHLRDGLNRCADVMITADADEWAINLTYFPRDIVNATLIFQHVCSNVGIKNGHIPTEKCAQIYGKRLSELVKDMTGYNPADIVRSFKE